MTYVIEFSPDALEHLEALRKFDQQRVVESISQQLAHEPLKASRNRKAMRSNLIATRELRVGAFRVYYDVDDEQAAVLIPRHRGEGPQPRTHRRRGGRSDVKTIELKQANAPLSDYAREVGRQAVLVVNNGKPVAVLSSVKGMDAESIALANSPKFAAIIERSRARQTTEGGIPIEEVRRSLGMPATKRNGKTKRVQRGK